MTACISLFRGINVGGHNRVKMSVLKEVHESLGLNNVLPYIQSGNVVFRADDTDSTRLSKHIEESFETTFGFHVEVFVRSLDELNEILAKNPFLDQSGKEPNRIIVMFLAAHPDEAAQEALQKAYAGPEEIFIMGKEIYLYYPDGMGHSKLTGSLIEKKLKTFGTARNLNTTLQLQKMMQEL